MFNLRRQLFINFYLGEANGNATLAARKAGYPHANVASARLLANASVREAIQNRVASVAMSADEVLLRLSHHASTDMTDFMKVDPKNGTPSLDLRKARRLKKLGGIKKLKASRVDRGDDVDPLQVVEVELRDPIQSLALLAKYHGLDREKDAKQVGENVPRIVVAFTDDRYPSEDQS